MRVGLYPALGAEVAGEERDGVKRRLGDRREARVGRHAVVSVVAVRRALAAAKVGVLPRSRKPIEALERRGQALGRDIDLLRKLGDASGLDEKLRPELSREALVRKRLAGAHGARDVFVPVVGVEHHPSGDALARLLMVLVHGDDDVDVRAGFVGEALAVPVDEDAARQALLDDQDPPARRPRKLRHRRPPRLAHQARRQPPAPSPCGSRRRCSSRCPRSTRPTPARGRTSAASPGCGRSRRRPAERPGPRGSGRACRPSSRRDPRRAPRRTRAPRQVCRATMVRRDP